jgi:hypothetical protein
MTKWMSPVAIHHASVARSKADNLLLRPARGETEHGKDLAVELQQPLIINSQKVPAVSACAGGAESRRLLAQLNARNKLPSES